MILVIAWATGVVGLIIFLIEIVTSLTRNCQWIIVGFARNSRASLV